MSVLFKCCIINVIQISTQYWKVSFDTSTGLIYMEGTPFYSEQNLKDTINKLDVLCNDSLIFFL